MDTMETTKIVAGAVGALLLFTGMNFVGELVYFGAGGHDGEEHYAYAGDVEQDTGGAEPEEQIDFGALMAEADAASGEKVFGKCKACHKLDGKDGVGPHLDGVVGREIAAVAGFSYSDVLAGKDGQWAPETLQAFLQNPKGWAPGTKMSFAGLKKPEDRADVIAYLQSTGG